MRLWKYLLITAVVVGGYWTGYAMKKERAAEAKPVAAPTPVTTAPIQAEPAPANVDPNLILPPVTDKGAMIDIPIGDIGNHFRDKAGLTSKDSRVDPNKVLSGGLRPGDEEFDVSKATPIPFRREASQAPVLDPVKLPPTVRLPAPPEDRPSIHIGPPPVFDPPIKIDPVVKRIVRHEIAPWVFVNEREQRLNFHITKRGPFAIKAVELWARRSGDQPYECVDRMNGDEPPFVTRLWSEGNYELRIVPVNQNDAPSTGPSRDDLADLYVCLDTTPPVVELEKPLTDVPGVTKLRWLASDKNLDDKPIRLEYSTDGERWLPVCDDWLANTGEYAWTLPPGLPPQLQLRATARDKAGNVSTTNPLRKWSVDSSMPAGKITGIEERGPVPREVCPIVPPLDWPDLNRNEPILSSDPPRSSIDTPCRMHAPWEAEGHCMIEWLRHRIAKRVSSEARVTICWLETEIALERQDSNAETIPSLSESVQWFLRLVGADEATQEAELQRLFETRFQASPFANPNPFPYHPFPPSTYQRFLGAAQEMISVRHASFVEQLGPARTWIDENAYKLGGIEFIY